MGATGLSGYGFLWQVAIFKVGWGKSQAAERGLVCFVERSYLLFTSEVAETMALPLQHLVYRTKAELSRRCHDVQVLLPLIIVYVCPEIYRDSSGRTTSIGVHIKLVSYGCWLAVCSFPFL